MTPTGCHEGLNTIYNLIFNFHFKTKKRWTCVRCRTPPGYFPLQLLKKVTNSNKIRFQNFNFFDPNTYKTTWFLLHMVPWIFGVEDITQGLGDPGLEKNVLLSRNMPEYGTIVWFAGTCLEFFSNFWRHCETLMQLCTVIQEGLLALKEILTYLWSKSYQYLIYVKVKPHLIILDIK